MEEQQSQKRGIRSDAQKQERARDGYEPIAPANPVAGAFGEHRRDTPTDQELSLDINTRRRAEEEENE
ncbi:MAG TPA: hypothetical protein VIB00_18130 [Pyrinomonadaceae bacterium]